MRLIVGLGNFPPKYAKTRHNFGFLAAEKIAQDFGFESFSLVKKFDAEVAYGTLKGQKTILCKPQTFMNLSGQSVSKIQKFYKLDPAEIWVISDDLDQDFGQSRFREKGSSGGQKGLQDIIVKLGTDEFPRLKFGISNTQRSYFDTADFVVSRFTADEWEHIPSILDQGLNKLWDRW